MPNSRLDYQREWRARNREKINQQARARYARNPEKLRNEAAARYHRHPEANKAAAKAWKEILEAHNAS